jgi:hypothetical protein
MSRYADFIPSKKTRTKAAAAIALVAIMLAILGIVGLVKVATFVTSSSKPAPSATVTVATPVPGPTKTVTTPGPTKTVNVKVVPQSCLAALTQSDHNQKELIEIATLFADSVVAIANGNTKKAAELTGKAKKVSSRLDKDATRYIQKREDCRDGK